MEEKEKNIVDTPDSITADAPDTPNAENPAEVTPAETTAADGANSPATEATPARDEQHCPPKEKGFRAWWARHKPSTRRLIQIYSLLLYNAYMRGFIKGEIFTGITKTACVPGLNCYSCPGAVAACPLGALQNALTGTGHGGAYYILGILLLYGLIFGRTICGFLCPMGLGQDLLYKLKTPKLKKSRVTRILSYLKYVILAVLVIGIPIIYSIDKTAVPGFCKYICPAGTLEGAFMLLLNPANDSLYRMLGVLFSWKTVVLVCVFTASIFIYRFFCRFLCPLGAIYGLFNKFALLGIKVNRSKCTNCGKCVNKCKMDIKHVGDHECINCGECISVCPTKAISWKGSKIFLKNVDDELIKPTPVINDLPKNERAATAAMSGGTGSTTTPATAETATSCSVKKPKKKRDRTFWLKTVAIALAAMLYVGVFTYVNFFAVADGSDTTEYMFVIDDADGIPGLLSFDIGNGNAEASMGDGGAGTSDNPYIVKSITGTWDVPTSGNGAVYFKYSTDKAGTYTVHGTENLSLKIYYVLAGKLYALYDYQVDGDTFTLSLEQPEGYGNAVGDICYDFTLDCYNDRDPVTLSELRGKIVVVNFWGTWCPSCVKELPDFEKVRAQNADVEIIAIHSCFLADTAQNYIDLNGWSEWSVIFARDTGTDQISEIFTLLGGRSNAYPRTLVVDADGVIRSVYDGSVNEKTLTASIESARA